jgi:hypothetical protein
MNGKLKLNDLLGFTQQEISRIKIRLNTNDGNQNPLDVFKKNPLLDIIATGLYVNYMWNEIEGDEVTKFTQIYPIIEDYEVKANEIIKKVLLKDNPEKIEKYLDLTHSILISTFNFVSKNKIILGDAGILKDSLTVFYAVFLYTCCMDGWMDRP